MVACNSGSTNNDKNTATEAENPTLIGTWSCETYEGAEYTFDADGKGNYLFGGATMEFTYTDNGDSVSILYTGNTDASTYKYTIDGNKLLIDDSTGQTVTYIKK